ncbi:crystallin J1 [Rhodocytophaga rosea]|uniref:Crystallin J1 n=1 Tax=Rhodocytophaga rosea TaxID=2704465 RepID=A0A6C0GQE0_9BACT|nr:ADP-ribosylglycohydrolase family protein [Rhodocytophaga rosea]QHT70147.1 crystallin J1 [Rhodocytophaga rosea]
MRKEQRMELVHKSLKGLSIGDAFGDSFFGEQEVIKEKIERREIPELTKWEFTDDTVMSIAIMEILEQFGEINQEKLAQLFAQNYQKDINRGYGGTAHKILREIGEGKPWQQAAKEVFDGQGSMGNGAAMRSAPIGAYYSDNFSKLIDQSQLAAEITHANHEASVGAIAVALAASLAVKSKETGITLSPIKFLENIISYLEESDTKSKISKSLHIPASYRIETVTAILGNGTKLLAQDTVPFALWCAAHHLTDFEEALWTAVTGLGDRDTIGAIVGSIVILSAKEETIPKVWVDSVEDYQKSMFRNKKI